jgi:hypothetical protein
MIKILSKEETPTILPISKGRNTLLRTMLLQLEVGQVLFLPKEDWKTKNSPFYIVSAIKKKFGMQYEYGRKVDGTGWLFRRTK